MNEVIEWLNDRWQNDMQCVICNENNWTVDSTVWQLAQFSQGNLVVGGNVQPVVSVSCQNCGNTHQFSAIRLGIVPPASQQGV